MMPAQKFVKNEELNKKNEQDEKIKEQTQSKKYSVVSEEDERGYKPSNSMTGRSDPSTQANKIPQVTHRVIELVESILSSSSTSSDSEEERTTPKGSFVGVLPKQQTNRQAYGTWNRDFDFTLTCIGYVIGLPNFFRFPFLCYKFGTIPFLIAYVFVMILVGIPIVFMEITIGQFFGVGAISAFSQMAPVITGVSYLLAWNSFINCWMTGAMLSWIRVYSGLSLSCLKGWQGCSSEHYYNTPMCWTGHLENCCGFQQSAECPAKTLDYVKQFKDRGNMPESIYYSWECVTTDDFCKIFGWEHSGRRKCKDKNGKIHSVYDRRKHASVEFLHGYVLGLRTMLNHRRRVAATEMCREKFNGTKMIFKCKREYLFEKFDKDTQPLRDHIAKDPILLQEVWKDKTAKVLYENPDSSSDLNLPSLAFTTVLFITLFLFDNLLRVSAVQYIFNGIPFCLLFYMLAQAFKFDYSDAGVHKIFHFDLMQMKKLVIEPEIWVEAVIQVLTSTGVGNGALISLASFNKYQHRYMFDVVLITVLNLVISMSATLLCFCTIAHYIKFHDLPIPFDDFIPLDTGISSVDFGFIVYSVFVNLLEGQDIHILLFFFMFSSFPSDTAIRLAQSILDAVVHILPRLRHHSTMALIAVASFYYLTLLPVTQNAGIYMFTHFEHYSLRFVFPTIVLMEVMTVCFVYKAKRLMQNAEQLGVVSAKTVSICLLVGLKYTTNIILGITLVTCIILEIKFRNETNQIYRLEMFTKSFAVAFPLLPLVIILFSVAKQLCSFPYAKWPELFKAVEAHEVQKKIKKRKKKAPAIPDVLLMSPERPSLAASDNWNAKGQESHSGSAHNLEASKAKRDSRRSQSDTFDKQSTASSLNGSTTSVNNLNLRIPVRSSKGVSFSGSPSNSSRSQIDATVDSSSVDSEEVSTWKRYIFWTEIANHLEDWPDRLDETDFESEGSSDDSDEGPKRTRVFHVHYPVMKHKS